MASHHIVPVAATALLGLALLVPLQVSAQTFEQGAPSRVNVGGVDFTSPADRQKAEPPRSLEILSSVVKPGDTVTVIETNGDQVTGKFVGASASGVTLMAAGLQHQIPADAVRQVEQRHRQTVKGLRLGAAIGAGLGLVTGLMSSADNTSSEYSSGGLALAGIGLGASMGVIYGALIGTFVQGHAVLYAAPSAQPMTTVVLTRHGGGIRLSFRF